MENLWKALTRIFSKALAWIQKYVLSIITEQAILALKDIAVQAVKELKATDLSNEKKRKEAFDRIKSYAVKEGIEAKDSVINLVVELAVASLKKEQK